MSVSQMAKMIGQNGHIFGAGDMRISVRIVDVKVSYGQVRYQITPLAGDGTAWINVDSIVIDRD